MKIVLGADHAGYVLKTELADHLRQLDHVVVDVGTHDTEAVDYPDYAEAVGLAVLDGRGDRGILVCGSGVGASVAANKLPGIRAAICHDTYSAHQGVEHDDMNVLVLGARVLGEAYARELVDAFVGASFVTSQPRYTRRLEKVRSLEIRYGPRAAEKSDDG